MNFKIIYAFLAITLISFTGCAQNKNNKAKTTAASGEEALPNQKVKKLNARNNGFTVVKSEAEWQAQLAPLEYEVMREKGTERAFSGKYNKHYEKGIYTCKGCNQELFSSETKFDSGTGWPSFFKPLSNASVKEIQDRDHGMVRTEVVCSRCGSHLGHVFDDGPKPTGLRYCLNSVSLNFKK